MSKLAICVNPMSGRDVRRLAARATNMTHEAKRDIVARIAAGADAVGVDELLVAREPFRIAAAALEQMPLRAKVTVLDFKLASDATDTETAVAKFLEAGIDTMVSLGGDGTNRAIVRQMQRAGAHFDLVPLSTGTNNVFPILIEPTIAGMAAGLRARGLLPDSVVHAAKVLHVKAPGGKDVGLIDAVLLERDHVGNLLPFDAGRLRRMFLSRAEPDAIGMSPIGGLIEMVGAEDDEGLLVEMGPGGHSFEAPLSPGLFNRVDVRSVTRVAFDVAVPFRGPGVLALDGDRDHKLKAGESATVELRRDGPGIIDVGAAMRWAVGEGIMAPGTT